MLVRATIAPCEEFGLKPARVFGISPETADGTAPDLPRCPSASGELRLLLFENYRILMREEAMPRRRLGRSPE